MLQVRGTAGGTTLTGTLYERGERAPTFDGAPNEDAPYVWICDEFYAVDSGGAVQEIDGESVNVAFEEPLPRGFDTRESAVERAREHVRTQFARLGIDGSEVEVTVERTDPPAGGSASALS